MIRGSRLNAQAMYPRMRAQEIISNNIANSATDGYQRERVAFRTELDRASGLPWPAQRVEGARDISGAGIQPTGGPLDVALVGPGFLAVQTANGERFTRAGSFQLGVDGTLITADGHAVLGDGGPLNLPPGEVSIGEDGAVAVNGVLAGALRVVEVAPEDLLREGQTLYTLREGAVAGPRPLNTRVAQGNLEGSNVETVTEMVEMIRILREYESNHKAMTVQGDTLKRLIEQQLR